MKLKFLLIIDAQNDFISGTLGSPEAQEARDKICNIIENGNYTNIFLTCDSHNDDEYLSSREGKFLPIKHCIAGTDGMDFDSKIKEAINKTNAATHYIVKNTFGSFFLSNLLMPKSNLYFLGKITAAATTGPTNGPRPTSSVPAIKV